MKKVLGALALGVALLGGAAFADTMEASYGNTITVTYPTGAVARYHFEPDGTWTATAPDGMGLRGRWEVAGDQLCFISPSTQRSCTAYSPDKTVGDTWEQTATDGTPITVSIVAGR